MRSAYTWSNTSVKEKVHGHICGGAYTRGRAYKRRNTVNYQLSKLLLNILGRITFA